MSIAPLIRQRYSGYFTLYLQIKQTLLGSRSQSQIIDLQAFSSIETPSLQDVLAVTTMQINTD